MKLRNLLVTAAIPGLCLSACLAAEPAADPIVEGLRLVEVASVADAAEQLYGQRIYMSLYAADFYHKIRGTGGHRAAQEGRASRGGGGVARNAGSHRDAAPAGSVYVIVLEDGLDIAGIGGLMSTAMKYRGLAGAIVDASVRDLPQIKRLQFPVYSRGIAPSTSINHYRFAGANVAVTCAGARVSPNDIIVADEDGVAVVPRAHAAEILKKAQELDNTEHSMTPFIEKFHSIKDAVAKFGRI